MQIRKSPAFFVAITMRLTHVVGSSTFVMTPLSSICCSIVASWGFTLTGTLQPVTAFGCASGSVTRWTFPGSVPRADPNTSGYLLTISFLVATLAVPFSTFATKR
uniref:Uncharacterized protein n=1 Tax=Ixodes ricinus TaxID=34613 RepID=A0A6B0UHG8_IXORI